MSPAWPAPLAALASTTLATVCVAAILMNGCAAAPDIPPWFDGIQRFPIKTVSVHGHRIAYLDEGQGPPLILIHGYGGSMWHWEHQQIPLAAHFRVITPDLIGSGLSDKPDLGYRPEDLIESMRGFMDALGLRTATLVGNSMGAGLAMGMALTFPEHVDKLVLIDGFPDRIEENLASPLIRKALKSTIPVWLVSVGNWLLGRSVTETVLQELVFDASRLTPAVIERSYRNRNRPGVVKAHRALARSLYSWEEGLAKQIARINHPTLLIWGTEDRLFPPAVGQQLQSTIPGSSLELILNAGHMPQWEQPETVNPILLDFLSRGNFAPR